MGKLFTKLAKVQGQLKSIPESGRNTFHKYNYATAMDIINAVRPVCAENGLVVSLSCVDQQILNDGKAAFVVVTLTVTDSETGESAFSTMPGYAEDAKSDKSLWKAITGASKYAIRSFFCLATTDDPENDSESERTPKTAKADNRGAASTPSNTPSIQAITATSNEMKRLGWSTERGRLYLQNTFGKSSRQQMTEEELKQFLLQLRDMPTPQLQDTRP